MLILIKQKELTSHSGLIEFCSSTSTELRMFLERLYELGVSKHYGHYYDEDSKADVFVVKCPYHRNVDWVSLELLQGSVRLFAGKGTLSIERPLKALQSKTGLVRKDPILDTPAKVPVVPMDGEKAPSGTTAIEGMDGNTWYIPSEWLEGI